MGKWEGVVRNWLGLGRSWRDEGVEVEGMSSRARKASWFEKRRERRLLSRLQ